MWHWHFVLLMISIILLTAGKGVHSVLSMHTHTNVWNLVVLACTVSMSYKVFLYHDHIGSRWLFTFHKFSFLVCICMLFYKSIFIVLLIWYFIAVNIIIEVSITRIGQSSSKGIIRELFHINSIYLFVEFI